MQLYTGVIRWGFPGSSSGKAFACNAGVKVSVGPSVVSNSLQPMEFSRLEYWSGPFPSPGDLPNPGIELGSICFSHTGSRFFTS